MVDNEDRPSGSPTVWENPRTDQSPFFSSGRPLPDQMMIISRRTPGHMTTRPDRAVGVSQANALVAGKGARVLPAGETPHG